MNKFLVALVAALAVQGTSASNATAGTALNSLATIPATCSGTTISTTNCALCDTPASAGAASTYCTACNLGYQLGASATSSPTLCAVACTSPCLYCSGSPAPKASGASTDVFAAGNSNLVYCQAENQAVPSTITYANAICKNVTTAGVTAYATPGAISTGSGSAPVNTYSCYSCITNCMNCRPASGSPPSSTPTTCQQCSDGYYLSGNQTADSTTKIVAGTACTACTSIASITSATSNSAFTVTGVCNKCVNANMCINATCTKAGVTASGSSGSITSDTTSYTFDIPTQTCKAKSAARLAVAFAGAVAVAFVALF